MFLVSVPRQFRATRVLRSRKTEIIRVGYRIRAISRFVTLPLDISDLSTEETLILIFL